MLKIAPCVASPDALPEKRQRCVTKSRLRQGLQDALSRANRAPLVRVEIFVRLEAVRARSCRWWTTPTEAVARCSDFFVGGALCHSMLPRHLLLQLVVLASLAQVQTQTFAEEVAKDRFQNAPLADCPTLSESCAYFARPVEQKPTVTSQIPGSKNIYLNQQNSGGASNLIQAF